MNLPELPTPERSRRNGQRINSTAVRGSACSSHLALFD